MDHHGMSPKPNPLLFVCVYPIISLSFRASRACSTASATFHFLPVFRVGLTVLTTSSAESLNIISSLALPALYSSKTDLKGSLSLADLQYSATSDNPVGTPNHFVVNLFILAST